MSHRTLLVYMASFVFCASVTAGSLLFVMIAHTARARWFVVFRRFASAAFTPMPLLFVFFLPIALSLRTLHPAIPAHLHPWMDPPLFLARSLLYLATWTALAALLRHDSVAGDTRPSEARVRRERLVSAAGIPIMAVTLTGAAFDWVMPLSPEWASDVFGVYLFAGALGGSIGLIALASWLGWRAGLLPSEVREDHFHALGRVLLVGVIFWGYIAFVQFLLVWIADVPREVLFFHARIQGAWLWVTVVLGVAHFGAPFLLLLSRALKRDARMLAFVGAWMLAAHALDMYWLCVPPAGESPRALDLALMLPLPAIAALFGAWRFTRARPFPIHDPALAEALRYESP